ncbi:MAG: ATPase, T2SS/T4P/T4SS family, partial [Thermoanaerobaculia bacterium]
FASALRASLRQDPDVILVGEMRDLETVATALTAAETGHLILSTRATWRKRSTASSMSSLPRSRRRSGNSFR